jgi:AAA domain
MPVRPVSLRSPLVLIPSAGSLPSQLLDFAGREGFPQSPYDIESDLNALTAAGGVPVTLSEPLPGKTDWSVLVHTRRYLVRLFVTGKYGDAYSIASIAPLRLRDHQRLAQGYLLTRPRRWLVVGSTREIPQNVNSGWDALVAGWNDLIASLATTARPTGQQDAFLSTLGEVIDATERITTASEVGDSYPYREAKPTAGTRSGAAQSYEFTLAGARVPDEGAFVQVATRADSGAGTAKARGQVTRTSEMTITIRFDEPVDWNDLQGQGEITTTTSTVVFRMQREALGQLRTGRARNPGVLAALVDGQAQPPSTVRPPGTGRSARAGQHAVEAPPSPAFSLNAHQREAFYKTLAEPDLLAVIGPPGTGKTTTIAEIVRATVGRGQRVIVCSQNNRAVDNVLARLPADLLAIRVGNESRVTAEGMPYLLQRQAAELHTQALNRSRLNLGGYESLGHAEGWASELARRNAALTAARSGEAEALSRLDSSRRAAGGPATEKVDRLTAVYAEREREAQNSAARAERLRQLSDRAAACAGWLIIGWVFGLLSRRWAGKADSERARADVLASVRRDAYADLQVARRYLIEVTKNVPAVIATKTAAETAGTLASREHAAALHAARAALEAVAPMGVTPPPIRDVDDGELAAAERWLTGWLPLLAARRDLLAEWIGQASEESSQLYPELLRYAQVLASTCTGAGSRPELADLDFDLAIVDETGQIGVADALVPLVRARRAILVGDHMQLPPFLDSDVEAWGELADDPAVQSALKKSALEMVVDALPTGSPNVVWLTEQRRMPEVIAKFASVQFYDGRLETPPRLREHRDELFRSALAFVDTSALDWPTRRDRSGQDRERWGQRGYDNPGEARMLADLATHYYRTHQDWAVIVPYMAQAELIRRLLTGRAGDAEEVRLNVGTVDSFQGGERDVILYGFTRSNPERRVGFLSERRRVNVAMTRARRQLVLIGDLETLTEARDKGFRELARSLRDYVAGCGEVVSHDAVRSRLRAEGMAQ